MAARRTIRSIDREVTAEIAEVVEDVLRPQTRVVSRKGGRIELRTILGRRVVIDVRAYELDEAEE